MHLLSLHTPEVRRKEGDRQTETRQGERERERERGKRRKGGRVKHVLKHLKHPSSHTLCLSLSAPLLLALFLSPPFFCLLSLHAWICQPRKQLEKALAAPDVVRWAKKCPWWERKPVANGVVPPGSPGMCRVVMIASEEAVAIIRQLRDPTLCVLLSDESQVGTLIQYF